MLMFMTESLVIMVIVIQNTCSASVFYDGFALFCTSVTVYVASLPAFYDGISGWFKSVIVFIEAWAQLYDGNALRHESVTSIAAS